MAQEATGQIHVAECANNRLGNLVLVDLFCLIVGVQMFVDNLAKSHISGMLYPAKEDIFTPSEKVSRVGIRVLRQYRLPCREDWLQLAALQ